MTTIELTAESAQVQARELTSYSLRIDLLFAIARAIIQTAIDTLERCAREHCGWCTDKGCDADVCNAQVEQREIARLRQEMEKLSK